VSEEKFSKCGEGGEGRKNVSVKFRVFEKKNGRRILEEKKIKVFLGRIGNLR